MRGRLLVLEGLDGSGKATQAALLAKALAAAQLPVRQISFPNYGSDSSALVRMYLAGAFGEKPDDVNAYAASSFFAVDRYAGYKADWGPFYEGGGILIADRYTTSNGVHQCSKLPPEEWDGYLGWLFDYEYRLLGLPAPDGVIYLRVDPAVSQKLMPGRYHGDESKRRRILRRQTGLAGGGVRRRRRHAPARGHRRRGAGPGPGGPRGLRSPGGPT